MPTPWAQRHNNQLRSTPYDLVACDHPVLHRAAVPVENFGLEEFDVIAHRLYLTCKVNHGAAIAAPQVGLPIKMVVVDDGDHGTVFCNPVIHAGGRRISGTEACLSLPGRRFEVPRYQRAVVAGQDLNGEPFGADVADFQARMWQHEVDHLDGRLLVGRFTEIPGALPKEMEISIMP